MPPRALGPGWGDPHKPQPSLRCSAWTPATVVNACQVLDEIPVSMACPASDATDETPVDCGTQRPSRVSDPHFDQATPTLPSSNPSTTPSCSCIQVRVNEHPPRALPNQIKCRAFSQGCACAHSEGAGPLALALDLSFPAAESLCSGLQVSAVSII